jgi:hypothetical protein
MNLKKCRDCETEYHDQEAKHFGHCPKCDSGFFTIVSPQDTTQIDDSKNRTKAIRSDHASHVGAVPGLTDIEKLITAQKEFTFSLIAAQNKTTHAVRAFVRFLFIQLSGLTAAALVWYISLLFIDQGECINYGEKCDGNGFLQLLAIGIWIGTVIFSSNAAWSELGKSDIR